MGMFFAFIYAGMDIVSPGAIYLDATDSKSIERFSCFLYFSYTSLTTTGYGDIIPLSPMTRSVAVIEQMAGAVYLVIMMARLVGLHISQVTNKLIKS